jgi:hypothetical protein
MFPFPTSFIQAGIDPASSIDEFIEAFWTWMLEDQGILDSPRQTSPKGAGKSFIVPADEALTETELGDIFSSRAGLLECGE